MINILCVCQHGFSRSTTMQWIVSQDYNVKSYACGIDGNAVVPINDILVSFADIIICAEDHHADYIQDNYKEESADKTIISLGIPDIYEYRDGELIQRINEGLALVGFENEKAKYG